MWLLKSFWSGKQLNGRWWVACIAVFVTVQATAQRTVDVQLSTLGNPNVCGNRDVVVTISLSTPLYSSDSLLLFEFAVAYNPRVLEFVSPLFIGTLAEGAEYSGSGRIDSATIRVYAFNVTRPFRGQGPLCGLLFRYRSDCADTTSVLIAYEPEKNQEAKINYGARYPAIVTAIEQPAPNSSLKAQFSLDSIWLRLSEDGILPLQLSIPDGARLQRWRVTVATDSALEIRQVRLVEVDSLQLVVSEQSPTHATVQIESPSPVAARTVALEATVRWAIGGTARAHVSVTVEPVACSCIGMVEGDSLVVSSDEPSAVGIGQDSEVLTWSYDAAVQEWKLCGPIEQVTALVQWDPIGRRIQQCTVPSDPIVISAVHRWSAVALYLRNGKVVRTILVR